MLRTYVHNIRVSMATSSVTVIFAFVSRPTHTPCWFKFVETASSCVGSRDVFLLLSFVHTICGVALVEFLFWLDKPLDTKQPLIDWTKIARSIATTYFVLRTPDTKHLLRTVQFSQLHSPTVHGISKIALCSFLWFMQKFYFCTYGNCILGDKRPGAYMNTYGVTGSVNKNFMMYIF